MPTKDLAVSLENVHTDLSEAETNVVFDSRTAPSLTLHFPKDGGCHFFCSHDGHVPDSPREFAGVCPIALTTIPVLGPVDHNEEKVLDETVRRSLNTHRASNHFRNYWYYHKNEFERFATLLRDTWPGASVDPPEREITQDGVRLYMMCTEDRKTREIYWAGFGFQVWCQILTHLARSHDAGLLIVDEPEIYLHPDLQRHLVHLLREAGPDILLATHSSEIVNEAESNEVVLVDKRKPTGRRIKGGAGLQDALDVLGSSQNVLLSRLARNRRIILVEGKDAGLICKFARRLGRRDLANGAGVTFLPIGGFTAWTRVETMVWAFEKALGEHLAVAIILDRDFRCEAQVEEIRKNLLAEIDLVHIHARKEIENYLLVPAAIDRASNLRSATGRRATGSGQQGGLTRGAPSTKLPLRYETGCMDSTLAGTMISTGQQGRT